MSVLPARWRAQPATSLTVQTSNSNGSTQRDDSGEDKENDAEQSSEGQEGDEAGDEEEQTGPPKPVGFWNPKLRHVRKEAMLKWALTTSFLMAFILAVLSIYWGALFHVERNLSSLVIYVVDFDGQAAPYNANGVKPIVGPIITTLARTLVASDTPTLGYGVVAPGDFQNDPMQVRQAVYNFDAWAAIIVMPNATAMLQSAIASGNASYDPLGACQLIYQDARDDTNWYDFISPQVQVFMTQATTMVGEEFTKQVLQNASTDPSVIANAVRVPQALSPAIGFSQFNLRPFYPYQVIPSVSIGLIYLIIVSFFSFSFYLPIHFKVRCIVNRQSFCIES